MGKNFDIVKIFTSFDIKHEENTKKDYAYWINKFLERVQEKNEIQDSKYDIELISQLNSFVVSDVMNEYREKYSLSTQNKIVASLTEFGKFLKDTPEYGKNPFATLQWHDAQRVKVDQERRKEEENKDILSIEEVKLILDNIYKYENSKFKVSRNQALISILLTTGSRCREVLDMTMDMVEECDGYYMINYSAEQTKGDVAKRIPIANKTFEYFKNYIEERKKIEKYADEKDKDLVFFSDKQKKIDTSTMRNMLRRYCKKLNIEKNITTHTLRHTFRTTLTKNNVNENLIRAIGGWHLVDSIVDDTYFHKNQQDLDVDKIIACNII